MYALLVCRWHLLELGFFYFARGTVPCNVCKLFLVERLCFYNSQVAGRDEPACCVTHGLMVVILAREYCSLIPMPPVPCSAPPFIPYKPVPRLVPLPDRHTLTVKHPDQLGARAFGDLREDNLQLIIQVRLDLAGAVTDQGIACQGIHPCNWTVPAACLGCSLYQLQGLQRPGRRRADGEGCAFEITNLLQRLWILFGS